MNTNLIIFPLSKKCFIVHSFFKLFPFPLLLSIQNEMLFYFK